MTRKPVLAGLSVLAVGLLAGGVLTAAWPRDETATPGSPAPGASSGVPGTEAPTDIAPDGPDAGFARYDAGEWHIDYPEAWRQFRLGRYGMAFTSLGLITSQPFDVGAACELTPGGMRCDPDRYELTAGNVDVEVTTWGRIFEPLEYWLDPPQGQPLEIDGMRAIFHAGEDGHERRLTWEIAMPTNTTNRYQIAVVIALPADPAVEIQARRMVASLTFVPPVRPLVEGRAAEAAATAVRFLKANHAGYTCFPDRLDQQVIMGVAELPGRPLTAPLTVVCSTSIEPTEIGFWRMLLVAEWQAAAGLPAGRVVGEHWLQPDGTRTGGNKIGGDLVPFCCRQ